MPFEGNVEHLYLLIQSNRAGSVSIWNTRTAYVKIDLRGADLSSMDLSGYDFFQADLRGVNLSNAKLCGADFQYADLRNANLDGADLSNARFYKTNLSEAIINDSPHGAGGKKTENHKKSSSYSVSFCH